MTIKYFPHLLSNPQWDSGGCKYQNSSCFKRNEWWLGTMLLSELVGRRSLPKLKQLGMSRIPERPLSPTMLAGVIFEVTLPKRGPSMTRSVVPNWIWRTSVVFSIEVRCQRIRSWALCLALNLSSKVRLNRKQVSSPVPSLLAFHWWLA